MRKFLVVAILIAVVIACGYNKTSETGATAATSKKSPEVEKGLSLVANSDCFTCHKVAEASIGPAYKAVANKYEDDEEVRTMLAGKIIKGGAGNWGQVAMTPHPQISKEGAETMVKYVRSMKDNK